jgi:uncharacterized small protein (TIGR04563 family)
VCHRGWGAIRGCRLAVRAKVFGRGALDDVGSIVRPDTLLRWYRNLVMRKYDSSGPASRDVREQPRRSRNWSCAWLRRIRAGDTRASIFARAASRLPVTAKRLPGRFCFARAIQCSSCNLPGPKQSFYFPAEMLDEFAAEARRLDRSLSWVVQRAWRIARRAIATMPAND